MRPIVSRFQQMWCVRHKKEWPVFISVPVCCFVYRIIRFACPGFPMHPKHLPIHCCSICTYNKDFKLLVFKSLNCFPNNLKELFGSTGSGWKVSIREAKASKHTTNHQNDDAADQKKTLSPSPQVDYSRLPCPRTQSLLFHAC